MVYISGGNQLLDAKKILKRVGIKEGMLVADLGCGGAGHFIIPAAKMVGKKVHAYAVDILKSVLSEVSKKARLMGIYNIKPVWANLEIYNSTKIQDNSLDIALLINNLFQSKEHKNILREAKRIIKPGGKLLIVDWNDTQIPFGPPIVDRANEIDVKILAQESGFTLIDEFEAGPFHFGLTFIK